MRSSSLIWRAVTVAGVSKLKPVLFDVGQVSEQVELSAVIVPVDLNARW